MKKNIFTITLVVTIIIIFFLIGVGISIINKNKNKNNEREGWNIYKNQEMGVQFSYPENYEIREDFSGLDYGRVIYIHPASDPNLNNWRIEVQKTDSLYYTGSCSEISSKLKSISIIINGLSGKIIATSFRSEINQNTTFFKTACVDKGNFKYSFIHTYLSQNNTNDQDYSIFNRMVSSIKFLK